MADPWYPRAEDYFVPEDEVALYPVRQGDIFETPLDVGVRWLGAMLVHPSCEIQSGKSRLVQVARIHAVSELVDEFQQASVTYGFAERDGDVKIAFAHTFWLPPAMKSGPFSEPMFVDFREVALAPSVAFDSADRVRAMSHEARVFLIRRKIYFRYRWNLSLADVRRTEALRIGSDLSFVGPRPGWAANATRA